jgi:hypothetical protein
MSTRALVPSRRLAAAVILSLLAGLLAMPAGASADTNRSFTATADAPPCPDDAGQLVVTVTLRPTSNQQLGSANLTFPVGLQVEAAARPDVQPPGSTTPRATLRGQTVELRDLSAAPGAVVTVNVTVTPVAGQHTIDIVAKQANNFRGDGNDLILVGGTPMIVVDDCEEEFDKVCQPGEVACTYDETNEAGTLSIDLSGTTGPDGGGFAATFGVAGEDCVDPTGSFTRLPDSVELLGVGFVPPKLVVFRVDKVYDQQQPNNGVAFYQVCMQPLDESAEFTDRFGNEVRVDPDVSEGELAAGFVRDCADANDYPCIASRQKDDGFPIITVQWGSRARTL